MTPFRTLYEVLQVDWRASAAVIQGAYRALLKDARAHPDLGGSATYTQEINEAYAVLSDPRRRADYDRTLPRTRMQRSPAPPPPEIHYIVICPACRRKNRVRDERRISSARCGACHQPLAQVAEPVADDKRAFRLGMYLYDKGLYPRALSEFQTAVRLKPDHAPYRYWLGRCLYQRRAFAKARAEFQAAVALHPGQFHFRFWLGQCLYAQQAFGPALTEFKHAAAVRPQHSGPLLRMSSCHYHMGGHEQAIVLLRRVVALDPLRPQPHEWLGINHLALKRPAAALEEFRTAERLRPGQPGVRRLIEACLAASA
ncbi:MAG: tetratricopeptide repeat protein [Candidatus Lambdaproteobacteria bacterium]|nr:tetratricopeptide repeat protein [Candidatus Lambdaproteobacteria bacterium]